MKEEEEHIPLTIYLSVVRKSFESQTSGDGNVSGLYSLMCIILTFHSPSCSNKVGLTPSVPPKAETPFSSINGTYYSF